MHLSIIMTPEKLDSKIAICYCLHDDHWFLEASIHSVRSAGEVFAFVSKVAWNGPAGDWEKCKAMSSGLAAYDEATWTRLWEVSDTMVCR